MSLSWLSLVIPNMVDKSGRLLLAGLELYIVGVLSSECGIGGEVGLDTTGDEALLKSADLIREGDCLCSFVAELPMMTKL